MTETGPPSARDDTGKPRLDLVFQFLPAMVALADLIEAGRVKYPDDSEGKPNWERGQKPDSEYIAASFRHLASLANGVTRDEELGTMTAAAVIWNMCALLTCNYPDSIREVT